MLGAVVMIGLFALGSSIDVPGEPSEPLTAAEAVGGGLAAAGMGAAIGAGITWMLPGRESDVVFYRPRPTAEATGRRGRRLAPALLSRAGRATSNDLVAYAIEASAWRADGRP